MISHSENDIFKNSAFDEKYLQFVIVRSQNVSQTILISRSHQNNRQKEKQNMVNEVSLFLFVT